MTNSGHVNAIEPRDFAIGEIGKREAPEMFIASFLCDVFHRLPSFGRVWNQGPRWQSRYVLPASLYVRLLFCFEFFYV